MTDILQRLQNVGNIAFEDINDAIAEITRLRADAASWKDTTCKQADECNDLLHEIERLRAASKWQPIGTAQRDDDKYILIWSGVAHYVATFAHDDKQGQPKWAPEGMPFVYATHWQPLPSPPTQDGGE